MSDKQLDDYELNILDALANDLESFNIIYGEIYEDEDMQDYKHKNEILERIKLLIANKYIDACVYNEKTTTFDTIILENEDLETIWFRLTESGKKVLEHNIE